MNSRDAAYDDAIALSILGPGSAAMRARLEKRKGGARGAEGGDRSGSNRDDDSECVGSFSFPLTPLREENRSLTPFG